MTRNAAYMFFRYALSTTMIRWFLVYFLFYIPQALPGRLHLLPNLAFSPDDIWPSRNFLTLNGVQPQ